MASATPSDAPLRGGAADSYHVTPRGGIWFAVSLFAIGFLARLAPLFDGGGRLLRQFPSEDGYLMLTLARNLALGNGMSSAEGSIPSNGVQPLATFLYALVFRLVGGDKTQGVLGVLVLQFVIAAAAAYVMYLLARRILAGRKHGKAAALVAAALWFVDPNVVRHTMNCLETGLYGLALGVVLLLVLRAPREPVLPSKWPATPTPLAWAHWAQIGIALGVAFWARNDAVLVCLVVAVVHLVWGLPGAPRPFAHRFAQLSLAGTLVAAIAAPWLIFNQLEFGSVVPVSGQSEALDAVFAQNLALTAPNLLEYAMMPLVVPHALEEHPLVAALSAALLAALVFYLLRNARGDGCDVRKSALRIGLLMALAFVSFYGLWFGAGHFMSRYMFALSPLCAVLLGDVFVSTLDGAQQSVQRGLPFRLALPGAVAAVSLALLVRDYRGGTQHMHFQVVDWVRDNLSEQAWVGAAQTGTLGYFHDRTINLDGKVNPYALAARKDKRIADYAAQSQITHIVDWAPFASWAQSGGVMSKNFELKLVDSGKNLSVLQRRAPAAPRAPRVERVASADKEPVSTPPRVDVSPAVVPARQP